MKRLCMTMAICSLAALAGCESGEKFQEYDQAADSQHAGDGHSHAAVHGGSIIEFDAAHAHHAELIFDAESRDITLYFYGSNIGTAEVVETPVFELEEGSDEIHLEIAASPLDGETAEAASRFVVAGANVPENIKSAEDLEGHFHVTINGQEYNGSFGGHHDHGHEHGDHDHGDEHAHEHGDEDHGHDEEGHDHDDDGDDHAEDKDAPADAAPAAAEETAEEADAPAAE